MVFADSVSKPSLTQDSGSEVVRQGRGGVDAAGEDARQPGVGSRGGPRVKTPLPMEGGRRHYLEVSKMCCLVM